MPPTLNLLILQFEFMGNRATGPLRQAYNPSLKGWHITKSTNNFNVWQNISTGEEMEEYRFVLNDARDMNRQKQIFEFRYDSNILVSSRFFRQDTQRQLCSTYYKGTLFLQRIPIRLSNINDLPYPDVLHVYHQAFRGFAELHDKMGFFHIEQGMICVNQQGKIKVWANQQLQRNYSADGVMGSNGSQRDMVRRIIQLIHQNTDVNTLPDNLGEILERADPPTFRDADLMIQNFAARFHISIPNQVDSVLRREDIVKGGDSIYLHSLADGSTPTSINQTPIKVADQPNVALFHTFGAPPLRQEIQNIPPIPMKTTIQPQRLMRTVRGPQYAVAARPNVIVRPSTNQISHPLINKINQNHLIQSPQVKPLLPPDINKPTTSQIDHYELMQPVRASLAMRTQSRSLGTKAMQPLRSFRKNTVVGEGQTVSAIGTVVKSQSNTASVLSSNPRMRTESRNQVMENQRRMVTLAESQNVIMQPQSPVVRSQVPISGKTLTMPISQDPQATTKSSIIQHKIRSTSNLHQLNVVNKIAMREPEVRVQPQSAVSGSMTASMMAAQPNRPQANKVTILNSGTTTTTAQTAPTVVLNNVPPPSSVTNNITITNNQAAVVTPTVTQQISISAAPIQANPQISILPPTSTTATINAQKRVRTDGMTNSAFMNHMVQHSQVRQEVTFKSTDVHPQVEITQQSSRIEQPQQIQPPINMSFGNTLDMPTYRFTQRQQQNPVSHLPVTYGILKETQQFLSKFNKIKQNYNQPISSSIRDSLGYSQDDLNLGKNLYYNKKQHNQQLQQLNEYKPAYNRVVIEEYTSRLQVENKQLDSLSGDMKYSYLQTKQYGSQLPMYNTADTRETYRVAEQGAYTVQMDSDLMEDLRRMRGQR